MAKNTAAANVESAATTDVVQKPTAQEPAAPAVVAAPVTFEDNIAKLDAQIAMPDLFPAVKDALLKVRNNMIREEIRAVQKRVAVLRKMLPAREKRARKAKE